MSSGACRALAALLLTLVATVGVVLPAAAQQRAGLDARSLVDYTVDPRNGNIDVEILVTLTPLGESPVAEGTFGPIVIQGRSKPTVRGRGFSEERREDLPGSWEAMYVTHPRIAQDTVFSVEYTIRAATDRTDLAGTVGRVDAGYVYACVPGQASDLGSTRIDIAGQASFQIDQSGTILRPNNSDGLESEPSRNPTELFTCIEGTRDDRLSTTEFPGPDDRRIILQGWPGAPGGWLVAVESNAVPALDEIREFLGLEIPGDEPVIIRQSPEREVGGYASDHDTPGIVQVDENGGVSAPEHELAHAWFGTDNIRELWLREGLAEWTATSIQGAVCEPVDANTSDVLLQDWKVIEPTSVPDTIDQQISDQQTAACGIVSAMADRMSDDQLREVLGAMLRQETMYNGASGPGRVADPVVDYRQWLDAVDERGLVPAQMSAPGYDGTVAALDLDYAQDLLEAFGVEADPDELDARSAARARYHQFLIDAAPLGAPLAVRDAMDSWEFDAAMRALDKSQEVLAGLGEADALLPSAGLIGYLQPTFEGASDEAALDDVLTQTLALLNNSEEAGTLISALIAASPEGWGTSSAINTAIRDLRFDDILSAIPPSLEIVQDMSLAGQVLPQAGLLDTYKARYEAATSTPALEELAVEVAEVREVAEETATALSLLEASVGEWRIPGAVTNPIENGQIAAGRAIVNDARAVVSAAGAADAALPEAGIGAATRERFEAVTTGGEMTTLRTETELLSDQAQSIGDALSALRLLAPDWQIPPVIQEPVNSRDFQGAAEAAAIAYAWIQDVGEANATLPTMNAIERAREEFESAATLADLQAGADRADGWNRAADRVAQAEAELASPRDLLADFGLWGVDLEPTLEEAITAAVDGRSDIAFSKAAVVIDTLQGASSSGGLRLAGIVFLGVAILGVMGLWLMLRREAGPPWARQTKPHWVDDKKGPRLLGRGKNKDKEDTRNDKKGR